MFCSKLPIGRVVPNADSKTRATVAVDNKGTHPTTSTTTAASTIPTTEKSATATEQKPDDNNSDSKRKNAFIRGGLRRESSFRSAGSLLLVSSGMQTINVLRTSLEEIHERTKYRWVLHPLSPFKTAWDLFSALVVIYYAWMIPFMLGFEWYEASTQTKLFMKALDIWGFIDIFLRFRTGIVQYGTVVMNPTLIRKAYLHSIWFPIDIASTIPFEAFVHDSSTVSTRKTIKLLKYIKLPRLLRIGRFVKYVKKYKRYSSITIALQSVLFASHVAGCIWVGILKPCGVDNADLDSRCASGKESKVYWISFHHGIVSLLGISDMHVESNMQFLSGGYQKKPGEPLDEWIYLWSSGVSIVGAVITAILFGTIINLVQSWNRAENAFRKKLDQVTYEMDALCLPKPLRARVTAYYDYLWLNSRTFSEQLGLLQDTGMSLALRQQIAIYLFKDYLQKIPFFQLATDAVLGMICMQLHQVIYMPDDYIIREGDIGKELFMIVKGIVRVMPPLNCANPAAEKKILLAEGDFFGEIGVVMEVERTRSVKAECMAELCILSREGFDKILVEFPEFATAMKRLIMKRVGEMWNTEDAPERMEKMTRLADYKMKKSIQAYKNVQKLRGATHVMQSLNPRLSKLVKQATLPTESELEEETAKRMAVQNEQNVLGSIREQDSETERSSSFGNPEPDQDRRPIRLPRSNNAKPPSNVGQFSPRPHTDNITTAGQEVETESDHSAVYQRSSHLETQLKVLESKMDDRMTALDGKISQILRFMQSTTQTNENENGSITSSGVSKCQIVAVPGLPPLRSRSVRQIQE